MGPTGLAQATNAHPDRIMPRRGAVELEISRKLVFYVYLNPSNYHLTNTFELLVFTRDAVLLRTDPTLQMRPSLARLYDTRRILCTCLHCVSETGLPRRNRLQVLTTS